MQIKLFRIIDTGEVFPKKVFPITHRVVQRDLQGDQYGWVGAVFHPHHLKRLHHDALKAAHAWGTGEGKEGRDKGVS